LNVKYNFVGGNNLELNFNFKTKYKFLIFIGGQMHCSFVDEKELSLNEKIGDPVLKSHWMVYFFLLNFSKHESSKQDNSNMSSNILVEKEENYRKLNIEGPSLKPISKKQGCLFTNASKNGKSKIKTQTKESTSPTLNKTQLF
jgi:hypothetical protein